MYINSENNISYHLHTFERFVLTPIVELSLGQRADMLIKMT